MLLAIESVLIVPVAAILSMYAAVAGAEAAGFGGGSWGWGYMLAVPGGLVLGVILSGVSLAALKRKGRFTFLPILVSAVGVAAAVFMISLVVHGVIGIVV